MRLKSWVKYLLDLMVITDIILVTMCLYMMRIIEIGGV